MRRRGLHASLEWGSCTTLSAGHTRGRLTRRLVVGLGMRIELAGNLAEVQSRRLRMVCLTAYAAKVI